MEYSTQWTVTCAGDGVMNLHYNMHQLVVGYTSFKDLTKEEIRKAFLLDKKVS